MMFVFCVLALMISSTAGAAIEAENNLINPEMADSEGSYFGLSGTS